MQNVAQYMRQARTHTRKVRFTGTTAVKEGQGFCYVGTTGTATDSDERRDKYVAVPSGTNNLKFAGTAVKAYAANSAGQVIEIFEPGGWGKVLLGLPATVDSTIASFSMDSANPGWFVRPGYIGRGAAKIMQTVTGIVAGASFDGTATVSTVTISKTGAGANVTAGDICYVVGGAGNTQGAYTVASRTADTIVLSTAPGGSGKIGFYVVTGAPVADAFLFDGEPSGGHEHITPVDNAATTITPSTAGISYMVGTVTIGAGDTTSALGAPTIPGQRKGFMLNGALTTSEWSITSSVMTKPTAAATASAKMNGNLDHVDLVANGAGTHWAIIGGLATLA